MKNNEYEILQERKSHSDAYFPYNTYLCTIPLDFMRVLSHWHEDVEVISIKSGSGIIHVDMSTYVVKAGDIVVVRPGQIHSIYQSHCETMEYENIIFQSNLLYSDTTDRCTMDFFQAYLDLQYRTVEHIHEGIPGCRELRKCIDEIDAYCRDTPEHYQMIVKSQLYRFFFLLAKCQGKLEGRDENKHLNKIKQVIAYVEEHYKEDIGVESAARELGFSTSHFMKLFKQNMHTTFTSYLNDYRLNVAGELLVTTDESVMKIMEEVGFNNLSYFNRLFKEYFHVSPREYRK